MLRVRDGFEQASACGGQAVVAAFRQSHPAAPLPARKPSRSRRLIAMTAAGLALGAGGAILTASLVQAEDDAGIRSFFIEEAARKAQRQADVSPQANAYAPTGNGWRLPLFRSGADGRLAQPVLDLNPFRRNARKVAQRPNKPAPKSPGPTRCRPRRRPPRRSASGFATASTRRSANCAPPPT